MSDNTALAIRESAALAAPAQRQLTLLRPIADPAEVIEAQNATRAMVHQALKPGRDYGVVPGTGDKPTMLKPGAERVALAFGCFYGTPEIIDQEVDHDREVQWVKTKWVEKTKPANHEELKARGVGRNKKFGQKWVWQERVDEKGVALGLYRYVVRVPVINRATNEPVGSGVGSCSSMESKYVDRPRDSENTVLKMAFKRAMVAACLVTFGLSDEFTQDVEDLPQFNGGEEQGTSTDAAAAQTSDRAEEESEPEITTVEQALAMPLPGGPKAWNGKGGTPLGQLDAKMIPAIRKWIDGKIADAEKQDGEAPPVHYQLRKGCDLILEMRKVDSEKNQTKLELPATETPAAPVDTTLAPGKVEDALDTVTSAKPAPSLAELSRQAATLMKDKKIKPDERGQYMATFNKADTAEAMQALVDELELFLQQPF